MSPIQSDCLGTCLQRGCRPGSPRWGLAQPGSGARESLQEFDFDRARGLKRTCWAPGTWDFVSAKGKLVFLARPGSGRTRLALGLASEASDTSRGTWPLRGAGYTRLGEVWELAAAVDAHPHAVHPVPVAASVAGREKPEPACLDVYPCELVVTALS